ncbi:MAG: hypothetical protein WBG46_04095 [Nonlabens sp.]
MNNATINIPSVANWDVERKSESSVKTILNDNGNHFQFQFPDENVEAVHIYLGYDSESEKINFQVVKAGHDTKANTNAIALVNVKSQKVQLPSVTNTVDLNPHHISDMEATARVNSYIDSSKRDAWVSELFLNSQEVFQAFVVDAIDFEPGNTYDCFLGLKENEENNHVIDLIIYNTSSTIEEGIRDMTGSVPPYKATGRKQRSNFGLLDNL